MSFLKGLWEFLVGDDWISALGVVLALGITAAIADASAKAAWWVMPVAVVVLLAFSLHRAARRT